MSLCLKLQLDVDARDKPGHDEFEIQYDGNPHYATVNVGDRVREFSYKASGGRIGALFDGTERVLSIDAIHWSSRGTYAP